MRLAGDMSKDFKTLFRCVCGQTIAGARFGSKFHCLTCGRAWHLRQYGCEWWWPRGKKRFKPEARGK